MNENETTQPQGTMPVPPGSSPAGPPPQVAEPLGLPTQDERVLSALSHGLTFLEGGLIGPLILYFLKKDSSEFIAFHALQSIYFGLLFWGLSLVTCGLAAVVLIWPYLIFEAIAAFKAYEGEYYELPLAGKWARRSHGGQEPVTF